jgi:hypothetical protein
LKPQGLLSRSSGVFLKGGQPVKNLRLTTALAASLLLAPISAAMGQSTNIAYASAPRADYVVFFNSDGELSPAANKTVQMAAKAAASAGTVHIGGRADHAEAVKAELVREGVPADSIIVLRQTGSPLPQPADGIKDPLNRRVEISF